jgi:hypothetical protein
MATNAMWAEVRRTGQQATQHLLHNGVLGILIGVLATGMTMLAGRDGFTPLLFGRLGAALVLALVLGYAVAVVTALLEHAFDRVGPAHSPTHLFR